MRRAGEVSRARFALVMLALLALALAGCAAQSGATGVGSTAATAAPTVAAAEPTAAAAEPTMAATSEAAAPAAAGTPTVMLASNDKLGDILVDDKGMTLYLFTKDTKNVSNCYDQCATNWPPLLTTDKAAAGAGVNADLLGTTQRKDGTMQVTYNGWPLYYWYKDQKAGDATGQDVGGVWYVVNAAGEEVETPGGS